MHYYLVPWIWSDEAWEIPGAIGLVDLRNLTQMASPGGNLGGYAFAAFVNQLADPDAIYLGDDLARLTSDQRSALQHELAIGEQIVAPNLVGALWEVLTVHADPTGRVRHKPLMSGRGRVMELHLGGHSAIKRRNLVPNESPEWPSVLGVIREDYRHIRQQVMRGEAAPCHHRRVLTALIEKYGIADHTVFIPQGLANESPLPHSTTITESFNTADSDTLGPDLSWTEMVGDIDIVSNRAEKGGVDDNRARADSDLATDDHYAQISVTATYSVGSVDTDIGPICRKDSTATQTFYEALARFEASTLLMRKMVADTSTVLSNNASTFNDSTFYLVKIKADGSTISSSSEGTEINSVTDTAITGNLRCGFRSYRINAGLAQWDLFEAADLPVAFVPRAMAY